MKACNFRELYAESAAAAQLARCKRFRIKKQLVGPGILQPTYEYVLQRRGFLWLWWTVKESDNLGKLKQLAVELSLFPDRVVWPL